MESMGYDKASIASIYEFSLKLLGKSLSQVVKLPENVENARNRGDLGSLVEKYFFRHVPISNEGPDFPEANLELKTTGVIKSAGGKYKAKERLVLSMINYEKIVNEKWHESYLLAKCQQMLILFYLYEKDVPVTERIFPIEPILYQIPDADLATIKSDWETIQKKVLEGKAHELSEGDTFYLGACRKGAGGVKEPLRTQPFSHIGAKARAFSFKQNYLSYLIEEGNLKKSGFLSSNSETLEKATLNRFERFAGKSVFEISSELGHHKRDKNHKGFHRELAVRMLVNDQLSIPELKKAGIELKTIRLKENGAPRESMSFPSFSFMEIVNENWEDSVFFEKIESKFLLVIFKDDSEKGEIFLGAKYWNMPYEDRLEAQKVWVDTKRRVAIDATNLPSSKENRVAHVRPKGKNGQDKAITPQGTYHLKQSFWLNAKYVGEIVESL